MHHLLRLQNSLPLRGGLGKLRAPRDILGPQEDYYDTPDALYQDTVDKSRMSMLTWSPQASRCFLNWESPTSQLCNAGYPGYTLNPEPGGPGMIGRHEPEVRPDTHIHESRSVLLRRRFGLGSRFHHICDSNSVAASMPECQ